MKIHGDQIISQFEHLEEFRESSSSNLIYKWRITKIHANDKQEKIEIKLVEIVHINILIIKASR